MLLPNLGGGGFAFEVVGGVCAHWIVVTVVIIHPGPTALPPIPHIPHTLRNLKLELAKSATKF